MSEDNDQLVGERIGRHLRGELDGYVGRAEKAFLRHVLTDAPARRGHGWRRIGVGVAVAASVVAGVALWNRHGTMPITTPSQLIEPVALASDDPVERSVFWNTIDEGTVFIDDQTPARRLRRQLVEQTRWFDAQGNAQVSYRVPREDIMLVGYGKY